MADLQALKTELDTDPLGRGYSGMTDEQVADDLNTVYRQRNKTSVSGDEIFNAGDPTEYNALTQNNKTLFLSICSRDNIDPFGANNVSAMQTMFGGGSTTISNLQALQVENVSRATELGFGYVPDAGAVAAARAIP